MTQISKISNAIAVTFWLLLLSSLAYIALASKSGLALTVLIVLFFSLTLITGISLWKEHKDESGDSET